VLDAREYGRCGNRAEASSPERAVACGVAQARGWSSACAVEQSERWGVDAWAAQERAKAGAGGAGGVRVWRRRVSGTRGQAVQEQSGLGARVEQQQREEACMSGRVGDGAGARR
jgi:hypothetical protein